MISAEISAKHNWQPPRYQKEWFQIYALLPAYLSGGTNGSFLYYADGTVEQENTRLCWVLDKLLGYHYSSKSLLQQQSRFLLEQLGQPSQRRLPLLLTPDFCLVPVKARPPQSRNHGADGYVVHSAVLSVAENDNGAGCVILLKNGQQLFVLDSLRTLRKNLRLAEQLAQKWAGSIRQPDQRVPLQS